MLEMRYVQDCHQRETDISVRHLNVLETPIPRRAILKVETRCQCPGFPIAQNSSRIILSCDGGQRTAPNPERQILVTHKAPGEGDDHGCMADEENTSMLAGQAAFCFWNERLEEVIRAIVELLGAFPFP
jgi:hypothetical protein